MPSKNYIISESITVTRGLGTGASQKEFTLPAGMFVRPISVDYLPQYILDEHNTDWLKTLNETYVYCKFGLLVVPWKNIREI